jgi:hypothetical protein
MNMGGARKNTKSGVCIFTKGGGRHLGDLRAYIIFSRT